MYYKRIIKMAQTTALYYKSYEAIRKLCVQSGNLQNLLYLTLVSSVAMPPF